MKRVSVIVARVGLLVLALFVSAFAVQMERDSQPVFTFPMMDEDGMEVKPSMMVEGAAASLTRTSGGISASVRAHDLPPGHAMTLWLVTFNHPENCSDGVCNADDVMPPPGNLDVGVGVHYLDGKIANEVGAALFFGTMTPNNTDYAVFGLGFEDPFHTEFHYVLRTHGPASDHHDILAAQLGSFNGGCDQDAPHAPCEDIQFAVFK